MNTNLLRQVADEIQRLYGIQPGHIHVDYPGFISIPEKIISDDTDASDNVWAVGPDIGDDGCWTGTLMNSDGDALGDMSFAVYPRSQDPTEIAVAVYTHGIGDLYVGGGCPNCPYRR